MKDKAIKLVIFDLDGTLVNAYPAITQSFNYTMQKLKLPKRNPLIIRRAVGWGDKNLLRPFIDGRSIFSAIAIYRRHHRRALVEKSKLLPGASRLLTYLKNKGYRLAVASNRPTRFSRILIRSLKLGRYFDYVLCADKLKHIKPHPQILNRIMRRLRILPGETLYVGDMAIDAEAGRRAKVRTAIVATGSSTAVEIRKEKPYRVIHRLSSLLKML